MNIFSWTLEDWNTFLQFASLVLLGLTFAIGGGAILTGYFVAKRQDVRIATAGENAADAIERSGKLEIEAGQQRERAANAERDAADAKATAATAGEGTAKALAQVAEANERAAKAEARAAEANLALAKFQAPRNLRPDQQTKIAVILRSLGIYQVEIIIIGDSSEIAHLTEQIVATIKRAGWTVRTVVKAISGPNLSGVFVGTKKGSSEDVGRAANGLISALESAEIAAMGFMPQYKEGELPMALVGDWGNSVAPIRILVAAKP